MLSILTSPEFCRLVKSEMHFKMTCAICFNLEQSKILSSGNGLSQQPSTNSSVQIESVCRRQNYYC